MRAIIVFAVFCAQTQLACAVGQCSGGACSTNRATNALHAWATYYGADIENVRIDSAGKGGRGLVLLRDIEPGGLLMRIPYAICLSKDSLAASPIAPWLKMSGVDGSLVSTHFWQSRAYNSCPF
jgi:hypothetical protein